MVNFVIGITGKAGSGKDTFAEMLMEGQANCRRAGLADALKSDIAGLLNCDPQLFYAQSKTKEALRPLLQQYGDAQKYLHGNDYWSQRLYNSLEDVAGGEAIITDIRYDYEVEFARKNYDKFFLIQIIRQDHEGTQHSNHSSEQGLSLVPDLFIHNSMSLDMLKLLAQRTRADLNFDLYGQ